MKNILFYLLLLTSLIGQAQIISADQFNVKSIAQGSDGFKIMLTDSTNSGRLVKSRLSVTDLENLIASAGGGVTGSATLIPFFDGNGDLSEDSTFSFQSGSKRIQLTNAASPVFAYLQNDKFGFERTGQGDFYIVGDAIVYSQDVYWASPNVAGSTEAAPFLYASTQDVTNAVANSFDKTSDTTDDITEGTNKFATAAQLAAADSALQSVVAGTNITIDNTDPLNPTINASGGGGGGASITEVSDRSALLAQTTGTTFLVTDGYDRGLFQLYTGADAADGGIIIALTDARKVKRVDTEGGLKVDWWGRTSTNVQTAIDYATTNDYSQISFTPFEKYQISEILIDTVSDFTINGNGAVIEILDNADYLFSFETVTRVKIKDMTLIGENVHSNTTVDTNDLAILLKYNNIKSCSVQNVNFKDYLSHAIYVTNSLSGGIAGAQEGLSVTKCIFSDQVYDNTYLIQTSIYLGLDAEYATIIDNEFYRTSGAIRFEGGANSTFAYNQIEDTKGNTTTVLEDRAVIYAIPDAGNGFKLNINNNRINHNETKKYVILIDGDGHNLFGVSGSSTIAMSPCAIRDNSIYSNNEGTSGSAKAILIIDAPGTQFVGNTVRSQSGAVGNEVEFRNSKFLQVLDNTLPNSSSSFAQEGFLFDDCEDIYFRNNNTIYPFTTQAYTLTGTSSFYTDDIVLLKDKTVLDVAFRGTGVQITNVKINNQDAVFTDFVNASESSGTITSSGANNTWGDSGVSATNLMAEGEDCSVSHEVVQIDERYVFGMSYTNADANFTSMDYSFYCDLSGNLLIIEGGAVGADIGSYAIGDILTVAVKADQVFYKKNGVILHKSTTPIQTVD